jgi:crotonobetainyl-CoA:carnitine CoA-transferase CaiB-like acyl-CoA transferase
LTRFAPDWSQFHLVLNRNKRSLTCDAKTPEGQEIMGKLLANADVFITGNVGDANNKLRLDYDSVKAIKPDIVYCQATGFGASGPYAQVPTHGQMMEALGGGANPMELDERGFVTPTGTGMAGTGGVVIGPIYAAFAVAAALHRASRTGEGCYIDVSCADASIATKWMNGLALLNPHKVEQASVRGSGESAKYQHYQTKDGKYILFCAIEAKFWAHWCRAVGREDLISDHRSDLVVDFGTGEDNLRREIQKVFHTKTLEEWMVIAIEHDIAMGPALRFEQVKDDPHIRAREQVVVEHHPVVGDFLTFGNPVLVPGKTFTITSAPSHGQHTDEVLAELGYDETAREKLRADSVV